MADKTPQFPTMWITQNVALRELVSVSCVLKWSSMASSAKRRAIETGLNPQDSDESSDEGLEDSGDEDNEDSEEINEEVIVDFEAHTISDNDFHGIKTLLQQLFLKSQGGRQAEVPEDSDDEGDPDEVFGVISMVNLTERQGVECLEKLKDMLIEQCAKSSSPDVQERFEQLLLGSSRVCVCVCVCVDQGVECLEKLKDMLIEQCAKSSSPDVQERFEQLLLGNGHSVGLLLSERFVNVPPQIALPMHKQLQKEMAEAQRTNKPSGKCQFCLMISKTCKPVKKSRSGPAQPKEELLFVNDEEEFFYEQATLKFSYCVQDEADSCATGKWSYDDVPMKPFRTVMVIPTDKMGAVMDKMTEYLTV
ncbi:protein BCCIP homolog [Sinocyclocheilus rhinocerous]|uniref:protein BCCIP homolog n=1 Tax=Sinocyclocheilus rhinocerous TaxID=307959 RepID=UPI0007B90F56|nr:PREDICTED: protein BCCIP homolog [Sinocyclocheilus rhinocerous]